MNLLYLSSVDAQLGDGAYQSSLHAHMVLGEIGLNNPSLLANILSEGKAA